MKVGVFVGLILIHGDDTKGSNGDDTKGSNGDDTKGSNGKIKRVLCAIYGFYRVDVHV